ncbi:MAG: hypothetical protein ACOYXW_14915 [Actinomycetota bacterium]
MTDDIQLISDGESLAVIGDSTAVEAFLAAEGLPSKDLGLSRLRQVMGTGAVGMQAVAEISGNSGRWVKLTKESADRVRQYGLMETKTPGVSHAMIGKPGEIKQWIQISKGPVLGANPALLSGAAGMMMQLAMQQAMDEVTDYLAVIDRKLDDVIRAQKDAVLADMIGVELVIEEAMTVRDHVGVVSEVTWSKVQGTGMTVARTQAYALRQLDALASKVENAAKFGDLAEASEAAGAQVQEWLAVLARCFQLQDAIAILELDRVLDAAPDELDRHRLALRAARQQRMDLIAQSTGRLMARLDEAAGTANDKVLLHPNTAPAIVRSSNHVAASVTELDSRLGIQRDRDLLAARRWVEAASDVKDKAFESGADVAGTARRRVGETLDRARSVTGKLSGRFTERVGRQRDRGDGAAEEER